MNFQPITPQYIDKNEENLNSVLQRIFTATFVLVLAPSNFRCQTVLWPSAIFSFLTISWPVEGLHGRQLTFSQITKILVNTKKRHNTDEKSNDL